MEHNTFQIGLHTGDSAIDFLISVLEHFKIEFSRIDSSILHPEGLALVQVCSALGEFQLLLDDEYKDVSFSPERANNLCIMQVTIFSYLELCDAGSIDNWLVGLGVSRREKGMKQAALELQEFGRLLENKGRQKTIDLERGVTSYEWQLNSGSAMKLRAL